MFAGRGMLSICLLGLVASLLLVGIVSGTLLRHVIQVLPILVTVAVLARHPERGAYAALAVFWFWLLIVLLIWLFLLGLSGLASGHYSAIEVVATLFMAAFAAVGTAAGVRVGRALRLAGRLITVALFAVLQIAAMWVSFMPPIAGHQQTVPAKSTAGAPSSRPRGLVRAGNPLLPISLMRATGSGWHSMMQNTHAGRPNDSEYAFVADLYDHVVPYRDRADIAFFVDAASHAGSPVLELGCGSGRVLIPVARAGIDIVGLDLSPHMLAACRRRVVDEPQAVQRRVRLVRTDMRDFALRERFRLVTMPFRPFQSMLTVEDQLSCLDSVRRHLVADGVLILDVFNPSLDALVKWPIGEEFGDEPEFRMPDGRRVTRRHLVVARNRFSQVDDFELVYYVTHPDGRQERLVHAFRMRYLFRFEAEHLLARAGFAVEHLYAGYDRSEYGSSYPGELVFVARKAT